MSQPQPMPPYPPEKEKEQPWWINWAVLGVVVGGVYLIFFFNPFGPSGADDYPVVGRPMTTLELFDLDDLSTTLTQEDLKGKVTILHFWGAWSPVCQQETPLLAMTAQRYEGNEAFQLVTVACQRPARAAEEASADDIRQLQRAVKTFLQRKQIDVPVYADPSGITRLRIRMMGQDGFAEPDPSRPFYYPTTLLVDRNGFVRGLWHDFRANGHAEMERMLAEWLGAAGMNPTEVPDWRQRLEEPIDPLSVEETIEAFESEAREETR